MQGHGTESPARVVSPGRRTTHRVAGLVLGVIVLCALVAGLAWFLAPRRMPVGQRAAAPVAPLTESILNVAGLSPAQQAERRRQIAEYLQHLYDDLAAEDKKLPRDGFDPAVVASKVGSDPQKLAGWVRDNTTWVPYVGSLRGPTGVLLDRLGNSVDRSLLLAELLHLGGHNARLAHALLADDQAQQLVAKLRPASHAAASTAAPSSPQSLSDDYAQRFGAAAAEDRRQVAEARAADVRQHADEARKRVREQTSMVLAAAGSSDGGAADAVAAMKDYWWVQYEDGGAWTDLDPIASEAATTAPVAEPTETFGTGDDGKIRLDATFCHEVVVRLIAEQWQDGGVQEHTLLEQTIRPSDIVGQVLTIGHAPTKWQPTTNPGSGVDPVQAFRTAVAKEREWFPVLKVGKQAFGRVRITTEGAVVEPQTKPEGGPGGMLGGLGRMAGTTEAEEEVTGGQLTAEWIEFEIHTPPGDTKTVRHEVFDLLGPAARTSKPGDQPRIGEAEQLTRGLALLEPTNVLLLVSDVTPDFLGALTYEQLMASRDTWLAALGERDPSPRRAILAKLPDPSRGPEPLYAYAVAHGALSPVADSVFHDSVSIVTFAMRGRANDTTGLEYRGVMDVVTNNVGVVPRARSPFSIRVQQGVADTAAEYLVLGSDGECTNTTTVFSLAAAGGIGRLVVRDGTEPAWRTFEVPPDVRLRMDRDLADGYLAVLPARAVANRLGWWRVNPRTGSTLGVMDEGFHQEMTERVSMDGALDATRVPISPGLQDTAVSAGRSSTGWSRHYWEILREAGIHPGDPRYLDLAGRIIDLQWDMVRCGLMGAM